jgi:hypothetical protein
MSQTPHSKPVTNNGRTVSSKKLLKNGPLVVTFYYGYIGKQVGKINRSKYIYYHKPLKTTCILSIMLMLMTIQHSNKTWNICTAKLFKIRLFPPPKVVGQRKNPKHSQTDKNTSKFDGSEGQLFDIQPIPIYCSYTGQVKSSRKIKAEKLTETFLKECLTIYFLVTSSSGSC